MLRLCLITLICLRAYAERQPLDHCYRPLIQVSRLANVNEAMIQAMKRHFGVPVFFDEEVQIAGKNAVGAVITEGKNRVVLIHPNLAQNQERFLSSILSHEFIHLEIDEFFKTGDPQKAWAVAVFPPQNMKAELPVGYTNFFRIDEMRARAWEFPSGVAEVEKARPNNVQAFRNVGVVLVSQAIREIKRKQKYNLKSVEFMDQICVGCAYAWLELGEPSNRYYLGVPFHFPPALRAQQEKVLPSFNGVLSTLEHSYKLMRDHPTRFAP